jgi:Fe-S cluster assembly protein SufD
MDKTIFTNLFAAFDREAVAKYRPIRESARKRLQALQLPTARLEDWRFTNIAPLFEAKFVLPSKVVENQDKSRYHHMPLPVDDRNLPPLATPSAARWVFDNGRFDSWQATADNISAGEEWAPLHETIGNRPVPRSLGRLASFDENVFTALNTIFLNDGVYYVIPDGVVLAHPIEIVFFSRHADDPIVTHPRILIDVGKNAQVTVVERYVGEGRYFTNAVTEISVGEGAVVNHVKIQDESPTAYHIANTSVVMAAKSNFTTHYLSLGGALVRNEVRVRFDGEHAEATVNGLYLANGKQHIDNFTVIDHAQPNCASHELYKGILDGKSHGVFNGKIFVRKDAQKTDAKQTNKVLLLSDDATINTKPQLEIFADDVKCTHGATVGQLDPVQLFYLQSRGIPVEAARRLLTFAFANDIVNRLKIESLREELESRIVR